MLYLDCFQKKGTRFEGVFKNSKFKMRSFLSTFSFQRRMFTSEVVEKKGVFYLKHYGIVSSERSRDLMMTQAACYIVKVLVHTKNKTFNQYIKTNITGYSMIVTYSITYGDKEVIENVNMVLNFRFNIQNSSLCPFDFRKKKQLKDRDCLFLLLIIMKRLMYIN